MYQFIIIFREYWIMIEIKIYILVMEQYGKYIFNQQVINILEHEEIKKY